MKPHKGFMQCLHFKNKLKIPNYAILNYKCNNYAKKQQVSERIYPFKISEEVTWANKDPVRID